MNPLLHSHTAWRQWVTEIQRLFAEHGIDPDFFPFYDLQALAGERKTPEQVLEQAQLRGAGNRAGSTP